MAEIHHHEHHGEEGSNAAMVVAILVVLLLIGFLIWNFLPARSGRNLNVDVNLPADTNGGTNPYNP